MRVLGSPLQKLEAAESSVSWACDVIEASEAELRKVGGSLPTVLSVGKGARRGVVWDLRLLGLRGRRHSLVPTLANCGADDWRCGE